MPIHLSSTFARKKVETPTQGYEYSRTHNPTRDALEGRLATLENAKFGLAAMCIGVGQGAAVIYEGL